MATLYVVGTPIGNLKDITLRALESLKSADVIACEDTRVTRKLLSAHGISISGKTLLSYHAHSKLSRVEEIIQLLKEGKSIALVSDAGTPGISDPGAELVSRIRNECTESISTGEIKIESVPGPSALIAALSIAGIPCADFTFLGFLPHKKGRETLFKEITDSERMMIFYESPHRIMKTLESLVLHLGRDDLKNPPFKKGATPSLSRSAGFQSEKTITVCRELTKIFEEVVSGSPWEVEEYFKSHLDKVRGEFVVIVSN